MATINISERDHMQALFNLFREMSEATEAIIEMETVSLNSPNWARYHAAESMAFFLLSQYHKSTCTGDECEDNRREMINSIKKRTGCTDYHAGVIIDQLRAAA